jgi:hypothetical protein
MTTLKPGSMLLGTTRPAELRAWYTKALAPGSTGEGAIDLGGFLLVIDGRDDVEPKNDQPGRTIINFHVDDFDAVEAQLNAAGVEWISVEDRAKGRFGTFADPDGNYLQIIEWKKDGWDRAAACLVGARGRPGTLLRAGERGLRQLQVDAEASSTYG